MKPCRLMRTLGIALCTGTALTLVGCGRSERVTADSAAAEAKPAAAGWNLTGEVIAANPERGTLTVFHDEIPGFMPAMTMEFIVSPGDLASAQPGQRIRAWMYRDGRGRFALERIWPDDAAVRRTLEAAARTLQQETIIRGANPYREVGEEAPDFALLDQDGRVVQASRYRGQHIVLNFIFTRCPDAEMCPAATRRMRALQEAVREAQLPNVEFMSITLDPAYDTPGVLRAYADGYGIDTTNFSFLTGPEVAIKNLMAQLGVLAFPSKESLLRHSMATLLIDGHGRIVHREDGSRWEVETFLRKLRAGTAPAPE
jgi:protein SCO1/2